VIKLDTNASTNSNDNPYTNPDNSNKSNKNPNNNPNNNSNPNTVKWDAINVKESGDIPSPRWGHTITSLGDNANSFVLYGGRDESQVFGDAYLLTLSGNG
jgi:hypothetical protein